MDKLAVDRDTLKTLALQLLGEETFTGPISQMVELETGRRLRCRFDLTGDQGVGR